MLIIFWFLKELDFSVLQILNTTLRRFGFQGIPIHKGSCVLLLLYPVLQCMGAWFLLPWRYREVGKKWKNVILLTVLGLT